MIQHDPASPVALLDQDRFCLDDIQHRHEGRVTGGGAIGPKRRVRGRDGRTILIGELPKGDYAEIEMLNSPGQASGSDGASGLLKEDDVPASNPLKGGDAVAREARFDGLGAIQEAIEVLTGHDGEVGTGVQACEHIYG